MKTITLYELLGMVKDGKAPKKIKYQNEIYTMDDLEYFYCKSENRTPLFEYIFDNYNDYDALNEEIIILDNLEEEKKIPEKLDINLGMANMTPTEKYISNTVNEIIDYLKSKGDE